MDTPTAYPDRPSKKFRPWSSDLSPNKPSRGFDAGSSVRPTGLETMSLIPQQSFEEELSSHSVNVRTTSGKLCDLPKVTQQVSGGGKGFQSLALPTKPPACQGLPSPQPTRDPGRDGRLISGQRRESYPIRRLRVPSTHSWTHFISEGQAVWFPGW